MSDTKKNHEDCGKFALNEGGVLGIIMDVVPVANKQVYLGVPVDSDENWASLKPRILSSRFRSDNLIDAIMHLEPVEAKKPAGSKISTKIMYVNPPSDGSSSIKGPADFLNSLLSGFSDLNKPPMNSPDPKDFTVDSDGEVGGYNEDDGA